MYQEQINAAKATEWSNKSSFSLDYNNSWDPSVMTVTTSAPQSISYSGANLQSLLASSGKT